MIASSLKCRIAAAAVALSAVGTAMAAPALSWNLSRDIYLAATGTLPAPNPAGTWSFMTLTPSTNTFNPLSQGNTCTNVPYSGLATCWYDLANPSPDYPVVWTNDTTQMKTTTAAWDAALPHMHPDNGIPVVVRWTSPIKSTIKILGRFSDVDKCAGDGVLWSVLKNGNTTLPLASGSASFTTGNGDGDVFSLTVPNILVGDTIEFVVDANAAYGCDTTDLDVLIAAQLKK